MKITVVKEFTFEAAHYLPGHTGKDKNVHGHTYRLQIGVKGEIDLLETGMVVDFADLKEVVKANIVYRLDHQYLNFLEIPLFPNKMPTAERIVWWIVGELRNCWDPPTDLLPNLSFVRLYETPTSFAEWRAE